MGVTKAGSCKANPALSGPKTGPLNHFILAPSCYKMLMCHSFIYKRMHIYVHPPCARCSLRCIAQSIKVTLDQEAVLQ